MDTRFDIYYKDGRCRLVQSNKTPGYLKEEWQLGFSFYAFPYNFVPIPKNCTRFITYFRAKYPYDTYAIYPDFNPLDEFYEIDTEALNLTVSFTAYSDGTLNTIPLYVYERSVGEYKSIFLSVMNNPPFDPVFASGFTESALSPIFVAARPVNTFQCINTICMPSVPSRFQMIPFRNWEKIKNNPELLEKVTNRTKNLVSGLKDVKEGDDIPENRLVFENIYQCISQCREPNEKSYKYTLPQKDPIIL